VGSQTEEGVQNGSGQPIISIEEWRPKEPARVKEARLTRRAGREARYEQMMQMQSLGLPTKEMASRLGMSQRTVRNWKAAGSFPEAKKRRVAGRVPLMHLHASVLKRGPRGRTQ
jgi:predicted DNA-binding transcriptional regulator AlpA